jgi:uncharacterized membrane protein
VERSRVRREMRVMKLLYVGGDTVTIGMEICGAEAIAGTGALYAGSRNLTRSLAAYPDIEISHMSALEAHARFPESASALAEFDVLLLGDVGHDTIALYPDERLLRRSPNRVREIVKYVKNGGGLAYCGGHFSYQGRYGYGRWGGTCLADILPVTIAEVADDRVEDMEGIEGVAVWPDHPILRSLNWDAAPVFLGYNRVGPRDGADLLMTAGGDPLLAVWNRGRGRVAAFASSPTPHWGACFIQWPGYAEFWRNVLTWVADASIREQAGSGQGLEE